MNIYQRADSRFYWYDFSLKGKRYSGSTKRTDKSGAKKVLHRQYEAATDRVMLGVITDVTFIDAFERTVESVSGKTRISYDLSRRKLLGIGFSGYSFEPFAYMGSLEQRNISELKASRAKEGMRANSINIELRFLQRCHSLCLKEWGLAVNPSLTFGKLKGFAKSRDLSDLEQAALIALLEARSESPSARKALDLGVVLLDTGMRLSEALSLSWPYVDLEAKRIELYRSKTRDISIVPITDRAHEILLRLRDQKQPFEAMNRAVKQLRSAIDQICNTDELVIRQRGKATIHTLRDTFATRLVSKGMDLYPVGKLLGHSNLSTTAKYAHLQGGSIADDASRLLNARSDK